MDGYTGMRGCCSCAAERRKIISVPIGNSSWYICLLLLLITQEARGLTNIIEKALVMGSSLKSVVQYYVGYDDNKDLEDKFSNLVLTFVDKLNDLSERIEVDYKPAVIRYTCTWKRLDYIFELENSMSQKQINRLRDSLLHQDSLPEDAALDFLLHSSFLRDLLQNERYASNKINTLFSSLVDRRTEILELEKTSYKPVVDTCEQSVLEDFEANGEACRNQSPQQLVYNSFRAILVISARYYALAQYTYASCAVLIRAFRSLEDMEKESFREIYPFCRRTDLIKAMNGVDRMLDNGRNRKLIGLVNNSMEKISLEKSTCDLAAVAGDTYIKLKYLFYKFIVYEPDIDAGRSCYGLCIQRKNKIFLDPYYPYKYDVVQYQPICRGIIRDCSADVYNINSCFSNTDEYEHLRLDYYYNRKLQFGNESNCNGLKKSSQSSSHGGIYKCDYCLCNCDQAKEDSDRYFNLNPVLSDVEANRVITGLRFRIINHVVYIQIKEGKLLADGMIGSPSWKEVKAYSIEDPKIIKSVHYHELEYNQAHVYLDSLQLEKEQVMTGVRFTVTEFHALRLEIFSSYFDFETGKLFKESQTWVADSLPFINRYQLDPNNFAEDVFHKEGDKVPFTASSIEFDAGQSTVPYLDIQDVENVPNVPLSGVRLVLKKVQNAPVLSLNLLTYNFAPHL